MLVRGHVCHSFLHSPTSSTPTTINPVALFVSAINLHCNCPPSLLKALADTHPVWEVWLQSFLEEKRGIEDLDTYKKITLGKYRALREKGAPRDIPTMYVLTIKKEKSFVSSGRNHVLLSLEIMKIVSGERARSLLRSSIRSDSSPVWLLCRTVLFVKATVRTHSAKEFYLPTKSQLFAIPVVTLEQLLMNIGSLSEPYTACGGAHVIGTTRLMQSFAQSASSRPLKTHAFIQGSSLILSTPLPLLRRQRYLLVCMSMTLCIFWRTPQSKLSSVDFSLSVARSTLWVLSNGSLEIISRGVSHHPQLLSI